MLELTHTVCSHNFLQHIVSNIALKIQSLKTSEEIRSHWNLPYTPKHPLTHHLPGVRGDEGTAVPAVHYSLLLEGFVVPPGETTSTLGFS